MKLSYSQHKEDLVILSIVDNIPNINKTSVEFGGADGYRCSNTRLLSDQGWDGHYWDIDPDHASVIKEKITAENVNDIHKKYNIPHNYGVLSIDIDSNDYWVWEALEYTPCVVIIEFNPSLSVDEHKTIPYNPNFQFNHTNFFGASYSALLTLGKRKNYDLIACIGCNMIFALSEFNIKPNNDLTYKRRSGWPKDTDKDNVWFDLKG